jgi:outer membrane lipoprotein-sorting protein
MSELGDVLEAMNGGPHGFDVLLGEVASWSDSDVIRRAMEQRSGSAVSAVLTSRVAGPAPPDRPITRLWFSRDGRYRAEQFWGVTVFDGNDLWVQHGEQVTRYSSHHDPVSSLPCALLVRPASQLALAPFTIVERRRVAEHSCVTLECAPSPRLRPHLAGSGLMGADRVRVDVDPRTGVVLRVRSWFEGQPAMEMAFEALEYDAPLVHDPFRYDEEPGTEVRTERDIRRQMLEHMCVDPSDVDIDDEQAVQDAIRARGPMGPPGPMIAPGPGNRPQLADRHMPVGPPPDDVHAARAAVTEVVEHMSDTDDDGGLFNVQGGSNLGDAVQSAGRRVGADEERRASFVVDDVVFVRADEAVVAFRVVAPPVPGGFVQVGRVVLVGDQWKVERATMCNLLMAGVQCPPPRDEP